MVASTVAARRGVRTNGQESPLSVWIIDDSTLFSGAFSRYIERITGYLNTRCFDSAESALAALRAGANGPDVVLLDVRMPGINGLDAIVLLKRAAPESKIYMVTFADSDWQRQTALDRGADGYFDKSDVSKEELMRIFE